MNYYALQQTKKLKFILENATIKKKIDPDVEEEFLRLKAEIRGHQ